MQFTATKMALQTKPKGKAPQLLVNWNYDSGWWSSIKALCARRPKRTLRAANYFDGFDVSASPAAGGSLTASFLLHCAFVALLIYLPQALPAKAMAYDSPPVRTEKIYYRVPLLDAKQTLPRIAPAGPGARPGVGEKPEQIPALGSTASQGNLTIVSKPATPDNNRQTIYQRSSPPDLRIPVEVKLPNMVLGEPSTTLKSPVKVDPNTARPTQTNRQFAAEAAPNVAPENKSPLVTYLDPSASQPKLAIPVAGAAKPTVKTGNGGATGAPNGGVAAPGDGTDLLIVGVDPAPAGSVVALGPGNRWGEFSIAPPGGQPGSPGGSPDGVAGGGSGGHGTGGDGSTGVGPGGGGGGGGNSGTTGPVSISGNGGNEAHGALPSALIAAMVYPVPSAILAKLRKNSLVVSAGPIGGGGLGVYRALNCGKIYTVFLPMPGKNWTMQYCQKADNPADATVEKRSTVIHMESPIVPPEPDADSRFDFQRMPVPLDKGSKLIVLKGALLADGSVADLRIFQGVVPTMDEAARLAFGKWKFKAPMRDGKPIAVDILVGIPAVVPAATEK
jgi:hypothetical protein